MELTRICIVRHGETSWNAEKRIQGQTDIGLDPAGLAQAEAAANWLAGTPVAALYSSDLQRAQQTAASIAVVLGLPAILLPAMRERRYGLFEGLTYAEARKQHPAQYHAFEMRVPDFALPEGGESLHQLYERVTGGLCEIVARHPGQTVVLVTHGGVLDIVNRFVRGNPLDLPRDFLIPNAGISWVTYSEGRWILDSWAETAHLSAVSRDELP
jgi:probable phosphoglycerate mutase